MSDAEASGAGRREVAWRVFATEFDDATLEHSSGEEERAPNYVVTPTGARINRLFVTGVLTEIEEVNEDVLRARVVDPTGAFVVYAGQYQPEALAFLEDVEPPAFVAVTGKARTFTPDGSDRVFTSIRPESVNVVDADTRDRWTVQTAAHTLDRVSRFADALESGQQGDDLRELLEREGADPGLADGIALAMKHYHTDEPYLAATRDLAVDAARVVAGEQDAVEPPTAAPDETGDASVDLDFTLTDEKAVVDVDTDESDSQADEGETTDEQEADAEPESDEADEAAESESDEADVDEPESDEAQTADSDAGADPDEMYELDDEERERIEEEYGTEFTSGSEVSAPGEADIDTPEPAELEADEEGETDADESDDGQADLEDMVMEAMKDRDEGDGTDREELVAAVVDAHDADPGAVEDAIQDALMAGRCYEASEDTLKPI